MIVIQLGEQIVKLMIYDHSRQFFHKESYQKIYFSNIKLACILILFASVKNHILKNFLYFFIFVGIHI